MIKQTLIDLFIRFLAHERVQQELDQAFRLRHVGNRLTANPPAPYAEIQATEEQRPHGEGSVFITSRFRSGSTLLWNMFRSLDGFTAYYEPFNERRWFDPGRRGDGVDASHLGVNNYWREYEGLEALAAYYHEDWIDSQLMMDESSWNPDMQAFIDTLIGAGRDVPVLQFNRVDFRLPWLRHVYPGARLVHLYRHPRDQWCSFLTDKQAMRSDRVEQTYVDNFYLDVWCRDLQKFYPFLSPACTPHPYQRFYYLWKLSYLYGRQFADISISFEDLTGKPEDTLKELFQAIGQAHIDWSPALAVLHKPRLQQWKDYADEDWFAQKEAACERTLSTFLHAHNT